MSAMSFRCTKVLLIAALFLLSACNASEREESTEESLQYVQVILGKLDAGEREYRSIRITSEGDMSTAHWTEEGTFLGLSESARSSVELYTKLSALVSHKTQGESLGRRVNTIDVALVKDGNIEFKSFDDMPASTAETFDKAFNATVRERPEEGRKYIYLAPYIGVGTVDIDLTQQGCRSTLECSIETAVRKGEQFVEAPQDIDVFMSDGRVGRSQFGVKTELGRYRFWVLSPHSQ